MSGPVAEAFLVGGAIMVSEDLTPTVGVPRYRTQLSLEPQERSLVTASYLVATIDSLGHAK